MQSKFWFEFEPCLMCLMLRTGNLQKEARKSSKGWLIGLNIPFGLWSLRRFTVPIIVAIFRGPRFEIRKTQSSGPSSTRYQQDISVVFCPLPLCSLMRNFHSICALFFESLSYAIQLNWVCGNWAYQFPNIGASVILIHSREDDFCTFDGLPFTFRTLESQICICNLILLLLGSEFAKADGGRGMATSWAVVFFSRDVFPF